jgi:uncharacterized membrane protein
MSEDVSSARSVEAGQGWTWIVEGFGLFKKAPGIWIALVIVLFVILIMLAFIPVLGTIASFLLMPVFAGGLMLGCRALQGGEPLEIGHLFAGFKTQTSNLVVLGAIGMAGAVIVMLPVILIVGAGAIAGMARGDVTGMVAMGGSLLIAWLVALALSILLYMAFWFAPALVVLRGAAPVDAIKQSFSACLKNAVPFLVNGIVLFVLAIVASIPLGLGWLVLGPVVIASIYVAYRDIFGDA